MPSPRITDQVSIKNTEELVVYIRRLMTDVVGNELVKMHVDRELRAQAVKSGFAGAIFPVLVTGLVQEEQTDVSTLFLVSARIAIGDNDVVDEAYVSRALSPLKNRLLSKK
jgi:hypothetical protein